MRLSTTNHIRNRSLQLALLQANQCPTEQHAPNLDSCEVPVYRCANRCRPVAPLGVLSLSLRTP